ncbi:MAG TPA: hypothetical protein DDX03_02535 [Firmicutes bacterium]|nr:hypothetical protein [Bacillota bacterium]
MSAQSQHKTEWLRAFSAGNENKGTFLQDMAVCEIQQSEEQRNQHHHKSCADANKDSSHKTPLHTCPAFP